MLDGFTLLFYDQVDKKKGVSQKRENEKSDIPSYSLVFFVYYSYNLPCILFECSMLLFRCITAE